MPTPVYTDTAACGERCTKPWYLCHCGSPHSQDQAQAILYPDPANGRAAAKSAQPLVTYQESEWAEPSIARTVRASRSGRPSSPSDSSADPREKNWPHAGERPVPSGKSVDPLDLRAFSVFKPELDFCAYR